MLSMPPATSTSCVPATSMSCANMAARMPEPHILDSVTAPALGQTALEARLARWRLALACHQAVAKQHFGDQLRADACALHGGFDRCATQVVGGQRGKVALEAAHGGARCADDDDGIGHGFLQKIQKNQLWTSDSAKEIKPESYKGQSVPSFTGRRADTV
jgi:hypothetical protein